MPLIQNDPDKFQFNDLLVAWIVFKGRVAAPEFNVMDWVDQLHAWISSEYINHDDPEINQRLENALIGAIADSRHVDGPKTGRWPWSD